MSILSVKSTEITLNKVEEYAKSLPEHPPLDNSDLLNPDYTFHQKEMMPGFWQSLIPFVKSDTQFRSKEQVIDSVTVILKDKSFTQKDNFFINLKLDDQLVVWGDLHGAFHSLLRSLRYLQKKGLIDNSLRITSENIKFIFMGNIIDRSAYNLETLFLVLTLVRQNPDKVIYMRDRSLSRFCL